MVQSSMLPLVRGEWVPMSWEEFIEWSSEEGQFEWVDGRGIAYVANSMRHVRLIAFLADLLRLYVRVFNLGEVFVENALLRLPSRPSGRMPDIFVVGRDDLDRVGERWVEGPALLAVEAISEESADRDLRVKRAEYERARVMEYLTIDARQDRDEVIFLRLDDDGLYQPIAPDGQGRRHSTVLPGFWLDPDWFRHDPLPDVEDILLDMAPDAYWAWLLAKRRARGGETETP